MVCPIRAVFLYGTIVAFLFGCDQRPEMTTEMIRQSFDSFLAEQPFIDKPVAYDLQQVGSQEWSLTVDNDTTLTASIYPSADHDMTLDIVLKVTNFTEDELSSNAFEMETQWSLVHNRPQELSFLFDDLTLNVSPGRSVSKAINADKVALKVGGFLEKTLLFDFNVLNLVSDPGNDRSPFNAAEFNIQLNIANFLPDLQDVNNFDMGFDSLMHVLRHQEAQSLRIALRKGGAYVNLSKMGEGRVSAFNGGCRIDAFDFEVSLEKAEDGNYKASFLLAADGPFAQLYREDITRPYSFNIDFDVHNFPILGLIELGFSDPNPGHAMLSLLQKAQTSYHATLNLNTGPDVGLFTRSKIRMVASENAPFPLTLDDEYIVKKPEAFFPEIIDMIKDEDAFQMVLGFLLMFVEKQDHETYLLRAQIDEKGDLYFNGKLMPPLFKNLLLGEK